MVPIPGLALYQVAPFTGAWIEMRSRVRSAMKTAKSHPSRVRGLKCESSEDSAMQEHVAPFTGAWIEISYTNHWQGRGNEASHPSRVRGLKCSMRVLLNPCMSWSHPSRVRGLKYPICVIFPQVVGSRTLHGCVD